MAEKNKKKAENSLGNLLATHANIQKPNSTGSDDTPKESVATIVPKSQQVELFVNAAEQLLNELNFAKHADLIFCSPRSKAIGKPRIRPIKGTNDYISVEPAVIYSKGGKVEEFRTPTIVSAGIFYAVLQVWERQGRRPDGWVSTSGYEIFNILGKQRGSAAYDIYYRELTTLKKVNITFKYTYKKAGKTHILDDSISLFSRVVTRRDILDESLGGGQEERTAIQLNSAIVNGILHGDVKPFLFREYLEIAERSYDAAILYLKLDAYIA